MQVNCLFVDICEYVLHHRALDLILPVPHAAVVYVQASETYLKVGLHEPFPHCSLLRCS